MSKTKKAVNPEESRDYQQEVGMESRGNAGEPSLALAEGMDTNKEEINTAQLLEHVIDRTNLNEAYQRVVSNKGSAGVDKMRVTELLGYLQQEGQQLIVSILSGSYRPAPVRRVEIDKPDGGKRLLGIPTVVDRMIQQAISQVLTPIFEKEFSANSYGFRPGRGAHQAIDQARMYINEGYKIVVDIDLEKFFDRVNHDKLMYLLSRRISDKRLLKLIRLYLESGVMIGGLYHRTDEGTPQGGPLSPLMSNVMLDELDKELEKRGHRFCRYADDCNVYVRSRRAGARVMASLSLFLHQQLHLQVNQSKSAVDRPTRRKFLGVSFYHGKEGVKICLHPKSIDRIKSKIKQLTQRSDNKSLEERVDSLSSLIVGWVGYFRISDMGKHCKRLDEWMRRRLRMCLWKQWKRTKTKMSNLVQLGINKWKAWEYANTRKGYWRTSNSPILACSLTNSFFKKYGLVSFTDVYKSYLNSVNRRMPNGTYGGVRGQ